MIVIASDKFKGTLTAGEACRAIAEGLRAAGVGARMVLMPMADGGDGTAAILQPLLGAGAHVVESHACIGPDAFRGLPPMLRSSHALGMALREAPAAMPLLVGIGGTACCDGGAGMLQALGMKAWRADGSLIEEPLTPQALAGVARVDFSDIDSACVSRLTALADVHASLLPDSAGMLSALDFAPQKGFTDMEALARALAAWRRLAGGGRCSAVDGAGGGVGFAIASVLGAPFADGASFVADAYGGDALRGATLVVSGEGCIDSQTGAGKVVAEMARRARAAGARFLAIGGSVRGTHPFQTVAVDSPGTPLPQSPAEAAARLRAAAARLTGL